MGEMQDPALRLKLLRLCLELAEVEPTSMKANRSCSSPPSSNEAFTMKYSGRRPDTDRLASRLIGISHPRPSRSDPTLFRGSPYLQP